MNSYFLVIVCAIFIAGFQTATSIPPPILPIDCICTAEYAPVCGTNGKTYSNRCQLGCAQLRNRTLDLGCFGKCPCRCTCTREYAPVCGSDGYTYSNACLLGCTRDHFNKRLRIRCHRACPCPFPG